MNRNKIKVKNPKYIALKNKVSWFPFLIKIKYIDYTQKIENFIENKEYELNHKEDNIYFGN